MTTAPQPPPASSAFIEPPHGRAAALFILTFGTFVVGTGEFAIMGMAYQAEMAPKRPLLKSSIA